MAENFLLFKSSAGSGKTHTLVKAYLTLAFSAQSKSNFKQILAITFTNKATAEMKARVIENLHKISEGVQTSTIIDIEDHLAAEFHLTPFQVRERATQLLATMLHNYSDFAISTIDSFVQRIIRPFSRELGIGADFLTELDTEGFIDELIESMYEKLGKDKALTDVLLQLVIDLTNTDQSWKPEKGIRTLAYNYFNENYAALLDQIKDLPNESFIAAKKEIADFLPNFEDTVKAKAQQIVNLLIGNGIQLTELAGKSTGLGVHLECVAAGDFSKMDLAKIKNAWEDGAWYAKSAPAFLKSQVDGISDQLQSLLNELCEYYFQNLPLYKAYNKIERELLHIRVLNFLNREIEDFKQKQQRIHISEFNKMIQKSIAQEPALYIYERIGTRFRHYLIDEFQDTSRLQWGNLLPLIAESLSNNKRNLIVGDGKQAIYRWRGGDVRQMDKLPIPIVPLTSEQMALDYQTLANQIHFEALNTNYRSYHEIISFNNRFFRKLIDQSIYPLAKSIYQDFEQKPHNKAGGLLKFEMYDYDAWKALHADLEKDQYIYTWLKKKMKELLVFHKPEDICVLCRSNDEGTFAANVLLDLGYEVVSGESLLLSGDAETMALISLLVLIDTPDNEVHFGNLLTFYHVSIANFELALLRLKKERNPLKILQELTYLPFLEVDQNQPFNNLIFQYARLISRNPNANPFLSCLLDWIDGLNDLKGIADFIQLWERKGRRLSLPSTEAVGKVKIMTIHKSKGLQFKVVLMPFIKGNPGNIYGSNLMWVKNDSPILRMLPTLPISITNSKEEDSLFAQQINEEQELRFLDDLNVAYVGFTRAEEEIHALVRGAKSASFYDDLVAYMFENEVPNEQDEYSIGERVALPLKKEDSFYQDISTSENEPPLEPKTWQVVWPFEELDENRILGRNFHELLAPIETLEQLEALMKLENLGVTFEPSDFDLSKALTFVWKEIKNGNLAEYFNPQAKHYTERSIYFHEVLRPDKMLSIGNQMFVLDYKTGIASGKEYRQMEKYAHALLQMPNIEQVHTCLAFVASEQLITQSYGR